MCRNSSLFLSLTFFSWQLKESQGIKIRSQQEMYGFESQGTVPEAKVFGKKKKMRVKNKNLKEATYKGLLG